MKTTLLSQRSLKSLSTGSAVAALLACLVLRPSLAAAADEQLKPIFNGKDLTGWQVPNPNPFWRVADGVLIGENDEKKKGHVLHTQKAYQDFMLETEVRWSGEIDSGVMLREPELQLQIGVSRSLKKDMTGSFYTGGSERYPEAGQARGLEQALKVGDWNKLRLEARGDTFTVWLNGQKITQYTNAKYNKPAPIGLQIHPGLVMKVEFRNIRLQEL